MTERHYKYPFYPGTYYFCGWLSFEDYDKRPVFTELCVAYVHNEYIYYDAIDCRRYYPQQGLWGKWYPTWDDTWDPIFDNYFGRLRKSHETSNVQLPVLQTRTEETRKPQDDPPYQERGAV